LETVHRAAPCRNVPATFTLDVMWRLLLLLLCACHCPCTVAQAFTLPPAGKTLDESFRVALRQEMPAACVGWPIRGPELDVTIVLDMAELEQQAGRGGEMSRALVLAAAGRAVGTSGCIELPFSEGVRHRHLFDGGVMGGSAVVLDGRNKAIAPYAIIRFVGEEAFGGYIIYSIPGQRSFRSNVWWLR